MSKSKHSTQLIIIVSQQPVLLKIKEKKITLYIEGNSFGATGKQEISPMLAYLIYAHPVFLYFLSFKKRDNRDCSLKIKNIDYMFSEPKPVFKF